MKKIITSATIYYLCNMKKPVRLTYSMMNDAVKAHTHNRLDNLYRFHMKPNRSKQTEEKHKRIVINRCHTINFA